MTREDAIKQLKIELSMWESDCKSYHKTKDALKMAIKALEQEPCEDAISRKAMLDYQQYLHGKMPNEENHKLWEFIKELPPVTPVACIAEIKFSKEDMQKLVDEKMKDIVIERKVGKWTEVDTNMYTCSNCSHCFTIVPKDNQIQQFKYCPNCGSFMGE